MGWKAESGQRSMGRPSLRFPFSPLHWPNIARGGFIRLRSIVLILCTLGVLIAAFDAYLAFQPRLTTHETENAGPVVIAPPTGRRAGPLNAGKGVWVKHYDKEGRLASQLRAVKYDPVSDNAVHVTLPEARFFMSDGQVLRITGRQGVVITRDQPQQQTASAIPSQMPTRGRLEEVKIELYSPQEIERLDNNLPAHASLTATMNNAVFDSDIFRIYTDTCTIDGKQVPGEEVPVVVTGDEYDFSGFGLLVRWNDRLRRLELLEIHRGQQLTIKHPGLEGGLSANSAATVNHTRAASQPSPQQPQPVARSTPNASLPRQPRPAYRADFEQNVRIFRSDELIAACDSLMVDFKPRQSKESAQPPASSAAATSPAHPPAGARLISAPTRPARSASTRPVDSPMVIRWTGPLRITPVDTSEAQTIPPGQAIVRLNGAPATLTTNGNILQAPQVIYRTADAEAQLNGAPQSPVKMTDPAGATVTTQSMLYQPRQLQARLEGAGHAAGLVQSDDPSRHDTLDATWAKGAVIRFGSLPADAARQQMNIASISLRGNVHIRHPQVQLNSQQVDLSFDPSSQSPAASRPAEGASQLHSLLASGDVQAVLLDKQNGEQRLAAGRLKLTMGHTPNGRPYPKIVQADDSVKAQLIKQNQRLDADHLTAVLAPLSLSNAQPGDNQHDIALHTLYADGHVSVQDAHSSAHGTDLRVVMNRNQPDVTLAGDPAILLGQNGERLSGPLIHYIPAAHLASVDGPGQITASQASSDAKARPFHASWQTGIKVNGNDNTINLSGQVVATSKDADGADLTARGDTLTLLLTPSSTAQAQTASTDNFLQGKQVRQALFKGHASLQSLLSVNNRLQRRLYLESSLIQYSFPNQQLLVPQAGRMLVEDHQPASASTTSPSARGNTAFSWSKSFSFDQSAHQAVLLGDVRIVHQPDADNASAIPFSLFAQRITAEFSPTRPTRPPSGAPSQPLLQLTRLSAEDSVRIDSQSREVNAAHIAYDPLTSILTATGSDGRFVRLQNADGSLRGEFESLTYNLKEDRIVQMKNAQFQGRQ